MNHTAAVGAGATDSPPPYHETALRANAHNASIMASVNAGLSAIQAVFLASILALVIYLVMLLRHHSLHAERKPMRMQM